jgi:pyruvate dehydrogenase E2 component (dihydrolipoamide acetyltransferase)
MDVRLPNLGEGVDSGSVVRLFVKEGDVVTQGQTLLELENEKAVAPIPSPAAGQVASIRVKAGDKINVGQFILRLAEPGEAAKVEREKVESPPPEAGRPQDHAPRAEIQETRPDLEEEVPVSGGAAKTGFPPAAPPSVRKLARELGIDLTRVRGSQPGGRIVLEDVRRYIQRLQQIAFKAKDPPAKATVEPVDFAKWGPITTKPLSGLRQVISRRMAESWTTIPHVTQFDSADITQVTELRKRYAQSYTERGVHLTVTSFVLKALVSVLKKYPIFNASLDEKGEQVVLKQYVHIGLAVDTEAGLMVPVIREADTKSMRQLSKEIQEVADNARDRKLSLEEMKGGTFTISNQGGIGSGHFTPIINKPEVAILGVGRGALQASVHQQQIRPRLLLPLALSYDHRLIDGAQAARFMVDLVGALENFPEEELKLSS